MSASAQSLPMLSGTGCSFETQVERGHSPMAGAAMPIRDTTTWKMAFWAAAVDSPRRFPFSSVTGIPSLSSLQGQWERVEPRAHGWGIKGQGRDTAHLQREADILLYSPFTACIVSWEGLS